MINENGSISINTENIFPIIKKWLYSDKDIFIRELVSNACDAISKLKKLSIMGEAEIPSDEKFYVKVIVNKDEKTIKFVDNGIGMTAEEVKKYINQIAFSGAKDFIEKYKDKTDENSQIIGHFGLGFYSAFMVSDSVQIDTLSWQNDAEAVKWTSNGGTDYRMDNSDRNERGTAITLFINEDGTEFLDEFKMRQVLKKYCSFLPFEIYLEDAAKKETSDDNKDDNKKDEKPEPINDTHPLWLKNPKDCTDEEYKQFYKNVFTDFNDPLFWIHLNMDYPFNLKGILYFPKLKHEFETIEGQIKLYYNQVFVADNIKEVIPEFLMLLKGTIDCPDLPLNVSRSFLQNDGYVSKISAHITKKVADKLTSIFENSREDYNKYCDDINPFVKYGALRESKFFDKVKDIIVYKTINESYLTLNEYIEEAKNKNTANDSGDTATIYYVSNEKQQAQYIKIFKEHDINAVIMSSMIDNHFMQSLETKDMKVKFNRIDSDLSNTLKSDQASQDAENTEEKTTLENIFKEALGNDKLNLQVESLKTSSVPAMILLSEQSRRFQEMSAMFGGISIHSMPGMFGNEQTLVLNKNNDLIKTLVQLNSKENKKDDVKLICKQIYDIALMSHKQLEADAMAKFVERSNEILTILAEIRNN